MAGNSGTINIKLQLTDNGSVKILNQVGDTAEKTGKQGKKSFEEMDSSSQKMTSGIKGAEAALLKMGGAVVGLAAIGAAIKTAIVETVKMGMEFETTMKTVQAVSGATASEYAQLEAAARLMGATTEWSASQSAEALKYMSMAGMKVQDSIQALPGMLDLATAAQMDLGQASDIVTDVLTAFGMKTSELTRLSDAFINTSTRSNTTVQMLGEAFKYVAPVASMMGHSVEQTSAYLGVMANAGIKAGDAGTDLAAVMLKTSKAAEFLGLGAGASLNDVLAKMRDRQLSANDVVKIFGLESGKTAMVLMNNVDAVAKLNEELVNNQGATAKTAAIMRESTENLKANFFSAMEEISLKMYDVLEDDLRDALLISSELLNDNAVVFVDWAEKLSTAAGITFKVLIVGAGVVSDALSAMSMIWDGLKIPILALAKYTNEVFLSMLEGVRPVTDFIGGPLSATVNLAIAEITEGQKYLTTATQETLDHFTRLGSGGSKSLSALNSVLGTSKESTKELTKAIVDQGLQNTKTQKSIQNETAVTTKAKKKELDEFDKLYEKSQKDGVKVTEESLKQQAEAYKKSGKDKQQVEQWLNSELKKLYEADAKAKKKELDEFSKLYEKSQEADTKVAAEHLKKQADAYTKAGADKKQVAEWLNSELTTLYEADAKNAKKVEDEKAKDAQKAAADRAGAYRDMYKDLGQSSDDYIEYEAALLSKQRDDYETLTGDKTLADAWYTSQHKELLKQQVLDSDNFFAGVKIGMEETKADMMTWAEAGASIAKSMTSNMSSSFSDTLFAALKGDISDISQIWDGFMDSMLHKLTDTVAEMAVNWGVNAIGGITGWWDTGAWEIKQDHVAVVHKGEMIVPADIAQIVRSGEGHGSVSDLGQISPSGGNEWSSTDAAAISGAMHGIAGAYAGYAAQGLSLAVQGLIGWDKLGIGLLAPDPGVVAGSLVTGGIPGAVEGMLGLTGNFSTVGKMVGSFLGGLTMGGMATGFTGLAGGYLGDKIGDALGLRGLESVRDMFEDSTLGALGFKGFVDGMGDKGWDTGGMKGWGGFEGLGIGNPGSYGGSNDHGGDSGRNGDSDDGSSEGRGSNADGNKDGGRYAQGGYIDNLLVPRGEDGYAAVQYGEGVVSRRGMDALDKINAGSLGGMDPVAVGKAMAQELIAALRGTSQDGKDLHIHLEVDGNELGYVIARQTRTNADLVMAIRGVTA